MKRNSYEVVYDGYMSTVVKTDDPDGMKFTEAKKELLSHLKTTLNDVRGALKSARKMKKTDVE